MKQNYKKIIFGIVFVTIIAIIIVLPINKSKTNDEALPNNGSNTTINLTNMTYSGTGVSINNNVVTISYGGTYELTGTTKGNVIIDTEDDVSITLNNIDIESSEVPILVKNAKSVTINLLENTTNKIKYTKAYNDTE